ncbi:hypothetical protein QJQ45_020597 [Haematococcus lacustris]|nr:hypothetical protein QJQ45_020597 [Haematococcus lacustris]
MSEASQQYKKRMASGLRGTSLPSPLLPSGLGGSFMKRHKTQTKSAWVMEQLTAVTIPTSDPGETDGHVDGVLRYSCNHKEASSNKDRLKRHLLQTFLASTQALNIAKTFPELAAAIEAYKQENEDVVTTPSSKSTTRAGMAQSCHTYSLFSAFKFIWSDRRSRLLLGRMWIMSFVFFNTRVMTRKEHHASAEAQEEWESFIAAQVVLDKEAQMNVDDCCAVCAEPLEWTGVSICGHKETCSKCVARWRFVLKDTRCMVCKTEQPRILFTRFMGDFTTRLTAEQYDDLKRRADNGEVNYIASIEGYFNDPNHYQQIKSLCGYTHPLVVDKCKELGRPVPSFTTVPAVRKWLATNCGRQLCDICVAGRKVFLCEQLTYDKAELDRHLRSGDETGPLAESGFKGHPVCKFCRQRFYDSAELYKHMESAHEHCFLCRRLQPGTYVYYRHYRELEDHFRKDHHLCPHPGCLDKKFVVFASEQDLKRHMAGEHGDELKMSKAQRREANALPIPLQFREGQGAAPVPDAMLDLARPGVVIGGGDNVSSRHGRRQGPGGLTGLMRHSRSEGTMQGSGSEREGAYRTDTEAVTSVTFRADEFPSMASTSGGVGGPAPGWWGPGAVASTSGSGAASTPSSSSRGLSTDHFPSLPSMSKSAKKKLRQGSAASIAEQLRLANRPVRIISRATPSQNSSAAAQPPRSDDLPGPSQRQQDAAAAGPGPDGWMSVPARPAGRPSGSRTTPTLDTPLNGSSGPGPSSALQRAESTTSTTSTTASSLSGPAGGLASAASGDAPAPPYSSAFPSLASGAASAAGGTTTRAPTSMSAILSATGTSATLTGNSSRGPPVVTPDDFPSLQPGTDSAGAGLPPPPPAPPRYTLAAVRGSQASSGTGEAPAYTQLSSQPAPLKPDDFPSLGQLAVASKASTGGQASTPRPSTASSSRASQQANVPSPSQRPAPAALPTSPTVNSKNSKVTHSPGGAGRAANLNQPDLSAASVASVALGGVSSSLKAANKALIEKIQAQLADDSLFASFKAESSAFMRGGVSASTYHDRLLDLGLLGLTAELATLCPLPERRDALLAAHKEYLASPLANAARPDSVKGWVPPEAALAAAQAVTASASWKCPRCTLVNAPGAASCEVCGAPCSRQAAQQPAEAFPALGPPTGARPSQSQPATGSQPVNSSSSSSTTTTSTGESGPSSSTASTSGKAAGKKNSGTRISIGMGAGTARQVLAAQAGLPPAGGGGKSAWSQSGGAKLAKKFGALNDAWGEK